jgi:hypothetical protein
MRWAVLISLAVLAAAPQAQAAKRCAAPYAPVIKSGAPLSKAELAALREDVTAFIAASDIYQKCLLEAKDPTGRAELNQATKERVGRDFNLLVKISNKS